MTDKIDQKLVEILQGVLAAGISDAGMERIQKSVDTIRYDIEGDIMYRLKDELAPMLADWAKDMAQRAVEELLAGNEAQMRRYLSCDSGWTGRSTGITFAPRDIEQQHPVIHGELFEQGCVELRRDIVNAHRDLLVNERILDLEDQVKSLVAQVNKVNAEKENLWERLRAVS